MKVYTRVEYQWDGEKYVETCAEWYEYNGLVAECKGSDTADQQRQQELDMQKAAIDRQNSQQDYVKGLVQPFTTGSGQGYDPALLSALQTQFMNTNDQAFQSANGSLRNALLARGAGGGNLPISGDTVRGYLGLNAARAGSQSQGLQNIGLQNLQAALNNKWNAMSVLNGQPAQLDTQIGSTSNAASNALNAYVQSKNTGFLSSFTNSLGSQLGRVLGGSNASASGGWLGMGG